MKIFKEPTDQGARITCPNCGEDRFKVLDRNWLTCQNGKCGASVQITPSRFRYYAKKEGESND